MLERTDDVTKKGCEHPEYSRAVLADYVLAHGHGSLATTKARLRELKTRISRTLIDPGTPLAIPAGVAEVFGARLGNLIGVRSAPATLTDERPPDAACKDYHVKPVPGGWCLSKRIEQAIPLFFLTRQTEVLPRSHAVEMTFRETFTSLFDKRCPLGRAAYADFPDQAPQIALDAARWDSPQRLLQYCYRSFLYATYPHSSNALVDLAGRLWLIDFEKTYLSTYEVRYAGRSEDIERLREMVSECAPIMQACRQIGRMTPEHLKTALADIPENFWRDTKAARHRFSKSLRYGAFDDPEAALAYFTGRLERWQAAFGAAPSEAIAQTATQS